ncbi:MAG: integrase/recombinase XerC, partial [Solirubrobacteraceae bacterium]|nr:integrase/recombinase XerC [Solirubrobacteraceae bacterium]
MKNCAIPGQDRPGPRKATAAAAPAPPLPDTWREALRLFDADLRRRGMADATRRAYGADLERFAAFAAARGLDPAGVDLRTLRRFAQSLSEG